MKPKLHTLPRMTSQEIGLLTAAILKHGCDVPTEQANVCLQLNEKLRAVYHVAIEAEKKQAK